MSSNVIEIANYQRVTAPSRHLIEGGATIIPLPTAKERKLAHKIEAGRIFAAAMTMGEMEPNTDGPILMMMELAFDPDAGAFREKAATWLWRNVRVQANDDDGYPLSKSLRRYLAG